MNATRVVLLSSTSSSRPDMDLRRVSRELTDALRARPEWEVIERSVMKLEEIERAIHTLRPDLVFNACEALDGDSSKEPLVPLLLERLGVPFTGSDARCLALALSKSKTSSILRHAKVPVPRTFLGGSPIEPQFFPLIVKPDREDGSVDIDTGAVVRDEGELERRLAFLAARGRSAIVEQYIDGRELAVAFLGYPSPRILSPGEILFDEATFARRARILTYASKWDESSGDYAATRSVEATLSPDVLEVVSNYTLRAAKALGIRDYGRIDFRVDRRGRAFVIDANPNCDLSQAGGFMLAAARAGLDPAETVRAIATCAITRVRAASTAGPCYAERTT